jgi:hypothetical protein
LNQRSRRTDPSSPATVTVSGVSGITECSTRQR